MANQSSPRSFRIQAYTRSSGHTFFVTPVPVGDIFLLMGTTIVLSARHRSTGQRLEKRIADIVKATGREISFNFKKVPVGTAELEAYAIDRFGQRSKVDVVLEHTPEQLPGWLFSRTGLTRRVPKPWSPLQVIRKKTGCEVKCTGRTYRFAGSSFLESVTTRDAEVLASPVTLFGRVDGRMLRLEGKRIKVLAEDPDSVELEHRLRGQGLEVVVRTHVSFDGVIRYDWSMAAERPVEVDSLGIEIRLPSKHAEYLYHFPGIWGNAKNAGAMPDEPQRLGFRPYIWIGDDQRGLAWFSESDRGWYPPADGIVTEIKPGSRHVTLRLHLISQRLTLRSASERPADWLATPELEAAAVRDGVIGDKPVEVFNGLKYTFGLQATPVKSMDKDIWDYRLAHVGTNTTGQEKPLVLKKEVLDRLEAAGARTVVIHEQWTDVEGHWMPTDAKRVQKIVDECHARGLKILLYYSFLISDLAPEYRDFGSENVVLPKSGYPLYHEPPQPGQSAWIVCLGGVWQNFVVDAISRTMDQFGIDGVYLDGTSYPFGCCNTNHGCGTRRPGGMIGQTYSIFSVRSAMRRIYNEVKQRHPEAQINLHNSTCMVTPTMGWGTGYWDGEQFQAVKGMETAADLLPLDTFRAEFMGHQWGVPAEFLCYGTGFSFKQAWSIGLLHDVPLRPVVLEEDLELTGKIWKTMEAFDRKSAEWLPYWRNGKFVKSISEGGFTSLYRHEKNGVLLVVSNLNRKRAKIDLQLAWRGLGIAESKATIVDAMTGQSATLSNTLPAYGWKLLRIVDNSGTK